LVIQFTMQVSAIPLFTHACYDPMQIVSLLRRKIAPSRDEH